MDRLAADNPDLSLVFSCPTVGGRHKRAVFLTPVPIMVRFYNGLLFLIMNMVADDNNG
jgi:hypothetical protein